MPQLSESELLNLSSSLVDWTVVNNKLTKTFVFKNFNEAFSFMTQVAMYAEKHDHHPEWSNIYRTVNVQLITHDANGITEKDTQLAQFMDSIS